MSKLFMFANNFPNADVFYLVKEKLEALGYHCISWFLQDWRFNKGAEEAFYKNLKKIPRKTELIFITSSHVFNSTGKFGNEIEKILRYFPKHKCFYGLHDLGEKGLCRSTLEFLKKHKFNLIIPPNKMWSNFFKEKSWPNHPRGDGELPVYDIGHPKFVNNKKNVKYNSVFFPTMINDFVLHYGKPRNSVKEELYKGLSELGIPMSFPDYFKSKEMIKILRKKLKPNVLDLKTPSFDFLFECNQCIINANFFNKGLKNLRPPSSIFIEAIIAGCHLIFIGRTKKKCQKAVTNKINSFIKTDIKFYSSLKEVDLNKEPSEIKPVLEQYRFKMDKAIEILLS